MLSYSTRVIGYTLVPEAWMILLLEPLHGVTYALGKTASISFVRLKCDGAVGQSVVNVISGNLGTLVGLFLFGVIAQLWNEDAVYRGFGIMVLLSTVALALTNRKSSEKTEYAQLELQNKNPVNE